MKLKQNTLVIGILIVIAIAFVLIKSPFDQGGRSSNPKPTIEGSKTDPKGQPAKKLPALVDLGKGTCIPCKKMKPILDELKIEYQGKAIVEIIDLRYDRGAALRYGIRLIPTQIFYDVEGNEVYRHEGFMDKQSIINKFTEMGVH
ncbi:MAG: thioredoxin family protein [Candidatus Zixiibacteriota bacterium]